MAKSKNKSKKVAKIMEANVKEDMIMDMSNANESGIASKVTDETAVSDITETSREIVAGNPGNGEEVSAKVEKEHEIIHGFDVTGFYDFLYGIGYNMADGEKEFEMVRKIVQYGFEREMVFKDQFCEWLSDMLPGVGILDAAAYMNRGRLSKELIEALETDGISEQNGNKEVAA